MRRKQYCSAKAMRFGLSLNASIIRCSYDMCRTSIAVPVEKPLHPLLYLVAQFRRPSRRLMLIHSAKTGEDVFIDYREVAGMLYELENYGALGRQDVIQPAIGLAAGEVLVTPYFNSAIADSHDVMAAYPDLGALYLDDIGLPPDIETVLANPDLAKSLQIIADGGKDAFYTGEMAQAFVDAVNNAGGIMTIEDLANYEVEIRTPVMGEYRGYKVISSPGGTHLIQILNILENFDIGAIEVNSAEYLHLFSESFKIAFADRSAYMADSDVTSDVPLEGLTSKEYRKMLFEKINLNECLCAPGIRSDAFRF